MFLSLRGVPTRECRPILQASDLLAQNLAPHLELRLPAKGKTIIFSCLRHEILTINLPPHPACLRVWIDGHVCYYTCCRALRTPLLSLLGGVLLPRLSRAAAPCAALLLSLSEGGVLLPPFGSRALLMLPPIGCRALRALLLSLFGEASCSRALLVLPPRARLASGPFRGASWCSCALLVLPPLCAPCL